MKGRVILKGGMDTRNDGSIDTVFRINSNPTMATEMRMFVGDVPVDMEVSEDCTDLRFHRNDPFQDARGEALAHSDSEWGLSLSAMRVLDALSTNPALTAAELSEELGLSPRQVQRATKELRDGQVIERVGSRKDGAGRVLRHPMS